jgi:hypothetical protein
MTDDAEPRGDELDATDPGRTPGTKRAEDQP